MAVAKAKAKAKTGIHKPAQAKTKAKAPAKAKAESFCKVIEDIAVLGSRYEYTETHSKPLEMQSTHSVDKRKALAYNHGK